MPTPEPMPMVGMEDAGEDMPAVSSVAGEGGMDPDSLELEKGSEKDRRDAELCAPPLPLLELPR